MSDEQEKLDELRDSIICDCGHPEYFHQPYGCARHEVINGKREICNCAKDAEEVMLDSYAKLTAENSVLTARLEDIEAAYRRTLSDDLPGDEEHCACVPHLRRRIAELEAQAGRVCKWKVVGVALTMTSNISEYLYIATCQDAGNQVYKLKADFCPYCGGKIEVTK